MPQSKSKFETELERDADLRKRMKSAYGRIGEECCDVAEYISSTRRDGGTDDGIGNGFRCITMRYRRLFNRQVFIEECRKPD